MQDPSRPITTLPAGSVVEQVVDRLADEGWRRIAVDGVDGVGKTTFADSLADAIRARGVAVTIVHVDDFLNPAEIRYRRGRHSPLGYWLDSIDLARLRDAITATPTPVIVEGIFTHRDELVDLWDQSIFLHAPFDITTRRMAMRDHPIERDAETVARYVEGQRIYFNECAPWKRATYVIDATAS